MIFLSAAQPTDQGGESVVLHLVVVAVVGGTIFQFPMYSFLGCEKENFVSKWVWKGKNCVYHGALIVKNAMIPPRRSVKVSLSCFSSFEKRTWDESKSGD